jgi:hypothetical protein
MMDNNADSEGFHVIPESDNTYKIMFCDGDTYHDPFANDKHQTNRFLSKQDALTALKYMRKGMDLSIRLTREFLGV